MVRRSGIVIIGKMFKKSLYNYTLVRVKELQMFNIDRRASSLGCLILMSSKWHVKFYYLFCKIFFFL